MIKQKLTAINDYRTLLRKELKSSVFSLKSVINLLSWNNGVKHGIFLSFRYLFKIGQYVFALVIGSMSFIDIHVEYCLLAMSIKSLSLFCRH